MLDTGDLDRIEGWLDRRDQALTRTILDLVNRRIGMRLQTGTVDDLELPQAVVTLDGDEDGRNVFARVLRAPAPGDRVEVLFDGQRAVIIGAVDRDEDVLVPPE